MVASPMQFHRHGGANATVERGYRLTGKVA